MPDKINKININGTSYDIQDNVSGYITGINAADVSSALGYTPYNATNPNGYVNAAGAANAAPVQSVNGQTGTVVLNANDIGALPDDTDIPSKISDLTNDQVYDLGTRTLTEYDQIVLTSEEQSDILAMWNRGACAIRVTISDQTYMLLKEQDITYFEIPLHVFSGAWVGLDENDKPISKKIALAVSTLTNYPIAMYVEVDDVVMVNGYTGTINLDASDVGALPDDTVIPSKTSDLTNDSGFITGMTILSYGKSTWQDFLSAYNSNQVIYCRASSNSNPASGSQTRLAFMAYVSNATSPTNVEFQYYRSMSSHSATAQGDEVYVYKLTSAGTWTVTVRKASPNIVAGTGLSRSYSNDTVTLSLDGTIPTKTSDLTNDSGYLTLSTLPIYDGTVIIGT